MMLIQPTPGRAQVERLPDGVVIVIPVRRQVFPMLFLPVWLVGWYFGETSAIRELLAGSKPLAGNAFLLFWLAGWTVGGAFASFTFVWLAAGREVLRVSQGTLTLRKELFGTGRTREYDLREVRDLRVAPTLSTPFGTRRTLGTIRAFGGGPLTFDYGADTVQWGIGLDEAEAKQLLPLLAPYTRKPG